MRDVTREDLGYLGSLSMALLLYFKRDIKIARYDDESDISLGRFMDPGVPGGLPAVAETSDPRKDPCIRYLDGVLRAL